MQAPQLLWLVFFAFAVAGCTSTANPAPNAREEFCPPGEHEVCSGAFATRIKGHRDPFAVCHCEPQTEGLPGEPIPQRN